MPTARELSREDLKAYRPWARHSALQATPGLSERKSRAWEAARSAAQLLKEDYGARRVVVFGSLIRADRFTPWSDVDLAAWGIERERYYDAAGAALDLGVKFRLHIDVIDAERCPPLSCGPSKKGWIFDRDQVEAPPRHKAYAKK